MKSPSSFYFLIFTLLYVYTTDGRKLRYACKYYKQPHNFIEIPSFSLERRSELSDYPLQLYDSNTTQGCPPGIKGCYALWNEIGGVLSFVAQGCWDLAHSIGCEENYCAPIRSPDVFNTTKFCCCTGKFCNAVISNKFKDAVQHKSIIPVFTIEEDNEMGYVFLVGGIGLMVLCIGFILLYLHFPRRKEADFPPELLDTIKSIPQSPSSPPIDLSDTFIDSTPPIDVNCLEFLGDLGRGKYGTVVKANYEGEVYAVKKFPVRNDVSYYDEVDIYTQPWMKHPNIVKFFGSGQLLRGSIEYVIILECAPLGSLKNYLKANSNSIDCFYRMAKTTSAGLAFLHTEVNKYNSKLKKPAIVHRDLNPKNILVASPSGDCKLCDFGLSMCVAGSKFFIRGKECDPHIECLHEAGTIRYLAPEMLESLTNLGECEMSLKQIDIYALALVIWEMAIRCHGFYQDPSCTPPYTMAYESDLGTEATMELMQRIVTYQKKRPDFPLTWISPNHALSFLKDVIESSWDTEAESRLPAGLIEDRIQEFYDTWNDEIKNYNYIEDDANEFKPLQSC